jgi:hypothetical protein
MFLADWSHQLVPMSFSDSKDPFETIDEAIESSIDFRGVAFLPRHDAFEQVKRVIAGKSEFPFACPLWYV